MQHGAASCRWGNRRLIPAVPRPREQVISKCKSPMSAAAAEQGEQNQGANNRDQERTEAAQAIGEESEHPINTLTTTPEDA
jgi:hypothetical protein